jgi:hypothetical protein
LVEEIDLKPLEERDGDPRKKRFQVSASTLEPKPMEVRKCNACPDWCTQQVPLNVTTGKMGVERYPEYLQLRHE